MTTNDRLDNSSRNVTVSAGLSTTNSSPTLAESCAEGDATTKSLLSIKLSSSVVSRPQRWVTPQQKYYKARFGTCLATSRRRHSTRQRRDVLLERRSFNAVIKLSRTDTSAPTSYCLFDSARMCLGPRSSTRYPRFTSHSNSRCRLSKP